MKQSATVIDNNGNKIILGCDKTACEGCHGSLFCTNKNNYFEALNPNNLNVQKGEKVEIDLPSGKTIKTIFLSLGLPLLLFLPGYFVGKLFSQNEFVLLLFAIGSMALGFMFSALYFKKRKKEYSPSITAIIKEKEEEN